MIFRKADRQHDDTKKALSNYQAWEELMKDIGKVKLTIQPQKKSLQKVWEWLEKYVAPSLKLFAEVGKIEKRDYIGNLVANGEMNITQKQLYDDYIKSSRLTEEERRAFDRKYQTEENSNDGK